MQRLDQKTPAIAVNPGKIGTAGQASKDAVSIPQRKRASHTLDAFGAQWLLEEPLGDPGWIVSGLLPTCSMNILASQPKLGKSILCLQLGHCVSMGIPFLGQPTTKAGVLYLSLEDRKRRLQNRLAQMTDESTNDFQIVEFAPTLEKGLINQLKRYVGKSSKTKLVIVDTFQMARGDIEYSYGKDYADIRLFKQFAEDTGICLLLVHHMKKYQGQGADEFADISGTNGISGAADGLFVLYRDNKESADCTLSVRGRDVDYCQFKLTRTGMSWELIEILGSDEVYERMIPDSICSLTEYFVERNEAFKGTASELIAKIGLKDITPPVLGKLLVEHTGWLRKNGLLFKKKRTSKNRYYYLEPIPLQPEIENDGDDSSDS